ncbi:hypothetical protein, partial [Pseudomaricurvus sp.]|uniref:hypothetical protein n=1 Tax=Pseudomaricurvus sp. TaxID=2004510 RepID=UPI003F6B7C86
AGDCVVIAGKGHEDYQQIGVKKLPFSDAAVARVALKQRKASQTGVDAGVETGNGTGGAAND